MRGNTKPFGKSLSPCAEMPNHSGNDFRRVTEALNASIMALNKNESSPTLLRDLYSVGTNATILLSSFLFFKRITHGKWRETFSLYNSLCSIKCNRKVKKRETNTHSHPLNDYSLCEERKVFAPPNMIF